MLCVFTNIIQQSLVHDCVCLTNRKKLSTAKFNLTQFFTLHVSKKNDCDSSISFTNIIVKGVTGVVPPLPGQSVHCESDPHAVLAGATTRPIRPVRSPQDQLLVIL